MSDQRKVVVTYSDQSTRETTIQRLRLLFKDEDKTWRFTFFYELLENGKAVTAIATYQLAPTEKKGSHTEPKLK